jgi:hypothetical protein
MTDFRTCPHLSAPFPHLTSAPQTAFRTAPVIGVRGAVRGAFAGRWKAISAPDFPHLFRTEETMTHEPEHCRSVTICNPKPAAEGRTLAEYQADLVRRFGRVPSWPELAKRENAARIGMNPVSNMARPQPPSVIPEGTLAARAAIIAKGEATRQSILAVLTKPMTCPDVANTLRRTPQLVLRHLTILHERGEIVGTKVKRVMIWERRKEAAE